MRYLPIAWLAASLSLSGEHGGTKSFQNANNEYRKAIGSPRDESLRVQWQRRGADWVCGFESSEGAFVLNCADGSRTEGRLEEGEPAIATDKLPWTQKVRKRNPQKNGAKGGELKFPSAGVVEMDDWSATLPKGWIWNQRPTWSPDGRHFILNKVRDVATRRVQYTRSSPKKQLQPEYFATTYPKPGDELRTEVPVIFSLDGTQQEVAEALIADPFSISKAHWRDESRVWFEYIERGFGKYRLLELNAESGQTRTVAEEVDEKFIHVYEKCGWWDLGEGKLLWRSEADGWSHLYLIDEQSGMRKQLTSGEWVVRGVQAVAGDSVLFSLSGFFPEQDPYYLHYAHLNWKTGEMTMLTHGDGTHSLSWSPDGSYYLDQYSRVDLPPVHELRKSSGGSLVAVLATASAEEMIAKGYHLPERFVTTDREGRYPIHGVIWKPHDFDPSKKYPVVENIYAGPHGAFVPKSWGSWIGHKSEMMQAGFVVVQIDGRGTNFRGQEFQQFCYKNLKDSGFPDRKKWLTEAAQERPWMDLARMGLYGGSAGGQSTLAGLLWHGDFYLAGAADCGCHDNRMDKIWWNEQWMDWPLDESYVANSNTEHVELLKGALLITVGEVDTNVDPSSTMQVVDALIRADKDFEFYSVPNGGHGIGESPYLRRKRVEFFQRELGGAQ